MQNEVFSGAKVLSLFECEVPGTQQCLAQLYMENMILYK